VYALSDKTKFTLFPLTGGASTTEELLSLLVFTIKEFPEMLIGIYGSFNKFLLCIALITYMRKNGKMLQD